MDSGPIVKGYYRQRFLRGRWHGTAADGSAVLESLANILVGDDRGVGSELGVAAGVIAMKMSVDNELEGFVRDSFQGGFDFWSERRELVVNNHDAIFTNRNANIPARALQHIDIACHLGDLDFHFAEILLSQRGACEIE